MFDLETIGAPSMFRFIHNYSICEDVVDFRFEVGVECRTVVVEVILMCLWNLTS